MGGRFRAPLRSSYGTVSLLPLPVGVGLIIGGVCVTAAAFVGLLADSDAFAEARLAELILGLASVVIGFSVSRIQAESQITPPKAMAMFVACWSAMTAVAMAAFALTGELDSVADAFFEAVSASTTTGLTTVEEPEQLSHATRFLRVAMSWATGLGVLLAAVGILPTAIAGAELLPKRQLGRAHQLATTVPKAIRNIAGLYVLLTVSLMVAYIAAGMGAFDAVTYSLSTASTGGMANHRESLGHFDSATIEWIGAAGMFAAGMNLLVVWWAIRGLFRPVLRSTELRLYVFLTAFGFAAVFVGSDLSASDSAVAVTSMLSTTGLRSANWGAASDFVQVTLIVGAGIGAMSGSVGSGFRQARVARIAREVQRSLKRLLEPHRVGIIRIDGEAVKEDSLSLTYGYLWMHVFTLGSLALVIYTPTLDLVASLTLVVSVVSNSGIVVSEGQATNLVDLSQWSELVAATGMLLGRLSIYPVLVTAAGVGRWIGRHKPHLRSGVGI